VPETGIAPGTDKLCPYMMRKTRFLIKRLTFNYRNQDCEDMQ